MREKTEVTEKQLYPALYELRLWRVAPIAGSQLSIPHVSDHICRSGIRDFSGFPLSWE